MHLQRTTLQYPFRSGPQEKSVINVQIVILIANGDPDAVSLREVRPEPLRGSDLDTRISYPPVIVKSDGPKQLFIHFIASSHQKLMALVVRIKELLCRRGMLSVPPYW
jgi:hypothetical protein